MARSDPDRIQAIDAILASDDLMARLLRGGDDVQAARSRAGFPDDAIAIIEPGSDLETRSGRAREKGWLLRFPARGRMRPDPLTGWAASDDPLRHLHPLPVPGRGDPLCEAAGPSISGAGAGTPFQPRFIRRFAGAAAKVALLLA